MDIREKILDGAGKLFLEHGTRQVTMDMIAQTLGISKRTIYENFKDKNDLLSNFLTEAIMLYKKRVLEIIKGSQNVIDALFKFGEYNQEAVKGVNPCFFSDIKKYHPEVFEKVMGGDQIRNYEITYTILKRGINEGNFRKEIDIEVANLFIHHSMEFFHKMSEERNIPHQTIWISVHLPYLRGICTDKGQELIKGFLEKIENQE
ncbi:MAG: TetR/AcrR family transcriptional regulator [Prolixibacteraceae bacterium]|nr:TetR/AcrR family transcriptional regulator [Prolixibacteraceae bacterium]